MSLDLKFYSASWDELAAAIGSRQKKLFRAILIKVEPEFVEQFDPDDFEDGPDLEQGILRWIDGAIVKDEKGATCEIENLGDALAFTGLVRYYGRFIGNLTHSMDSGDHFREKFLEGVAQQSLRAPYPIEYLISRPVLRYSSTDFPFWGGLSAAELSFIAPRVAMEPPTWEEDPEIDEWLLGLWNNLSAAVDFGRDLVTIYG
jgi:hypothetical protein